MAYDYLRPKPKTRIASWWGNAVVDALNELRNLVDQKVSQADLLNLPSDIIPDQANLRNLGSSDRPWNSIYAGYGYFSNALYVAGRRVLLDGDPISISDLGDAVRGFLFSLFHRDAVGLPFAYNLDAVFIGSKYRALTYGVEIPGEIVSASDYWDNNGLRCTSDAAEVSVWTRRTFKWPKATVVAKLPPPERGACYYPIALFSVARSEWNGAIEFHTWDSSRYDVLMAGQWRTSAQYAWVYVQDLLPPDYSTAYHTYTLEVHRWGVEFYIDGILRAVLVASRTPVRFQLNNTRPYAVGVGYVSLGSEYVFGIRVGNTNPDPTQWADRLLPISPHFVAVSDGDPLPPRSYPMYIPGTDTPMAGYSVSSESVESHPIPIYGYKDKTIYFMSDQTGTLSIQILTSSLSWREYDSVPVSAGRLLVYKMTGDALLVKVAFTPSTYPATILEAEVHVA